MSNYKTRPIGQVFKWRGVRLQVVKYDSCQGCYLDKYDKCRSYRHDTGYCSKLVRNDGKNVIFKQIFE